MRNSWWSAEHRGSPRWLIAVTLLLVAAVGGLVWLLVSRPDPISTVTVARTSPVENDRPVVVFLGDSYTAGTGASARSRAWPQRVGSELEWDVNVLARGGTGFTREVDGEDATAACGKEYCESFLEAARLAASLDPDIVVLSGGRNDALQDEDDQTRSIEEVLTTIEGEFPEAEVVITNPLWDDGQPPASLEVMSDVLQVQAERIGARFVSLDQPLVGEEDLVDDDGVHPNDAGHRAIADAFVTAYQG